MPFRYPGPHQKPGIAPVHFPGQARSRPGLARPEFVHSNVWTFLECKQITGSLEYRIQLQLHIKIQIDIQIQNR